MESLLHSRLWRKKNQTCLLSAVIYPWPLSSSNVWDRVPDRRVNISYLRRLNVLASSKSHHLQSIQTVVLILLPCCRFWTPIRSISLHYNHGSFQKLPLPEISWYVMPLSVIGLTLRSSFQAAECLLSLIVSQKLTCFKYFPLIHLDHNDESSFNKFQACFINEGWAISYIFQKPSPQRQLILLSQVFS